ncbi:hypothetical protein N7491_006693 [Penicillium cf. griseofulvum]|uniref:Uncharacterized protein n=1 Tax=Penicillium cf. griseofulvum TaxID=2972120 RepID=A0A9W9M1S1_9EURO|nr:hypothetical protein N7472_010279 [Penicillium cf. griseofulvum]KAJ5429677.1 hypothetical protein N7491_006693 [Penicillium cf. griseofulvum]KAJ5436556.1 hypothetical protein N7445_007441 [Penicillium cf. griseofulvum]
MSTPYEALDHSLNISTVLAKGFSHRYTVIVPSWDISYEPRMVYNGWQWSHIHPVPIDDPV